MRAVVICGGNVGEYIKAYVKPDDFVICADSGYDRAKMNKIKPNIVIGDMDSAENELAGENTVIYPVRKDFTDGELAVRYVLDNGFCEVLLFGMIGTRMDHTLANISLLKQLKGIDAVIIDANNEIRFTDGKIELSGKKGDIVSIIPFDGDVFGVTTEGLDYPLSDGTVRSGTTLGVSNVMVEDKCRITVKSGSAFIIRSKD